MTSITETPDVQGGEPCIAGTRIPVRSIVVARRRNNDADFYAYTDGIRLSREDVAYALAWYAQHPERVDEEIRWNDAHWVELTAHALSDYSGPDATDEEMAEIVEMTRWQGRRPWLG